MGDQQREDEQPRIGEPRRAAILASLLLAGQFQPGGVFSRGDRAGLFNGSYLDGATAARDGRIGMDRDTR